MKDLLLDVLIFTMTVGIWSFVVSILILKWVMP